MWASKSLLGAGAGGGMKCHSCFGQPDRKNAAKTTIEESVKRTDARAENMEGPPPCRLLSGRGKRGTPKAERLWVVAPNYTRVDELGPQIEILFGFWNKAESRPVKACRRPPSIRLWFGRLAPYGCFFLLLRACKRGRREFCRPRTYRDRIRRQEYRRRERL